MALAAVEENPAPFAPCGVYTNSDSLQPMASAKLLNICNIASDRENPRPQLDVTRMGFRTACLHLRLPT